MNSKSIYKKYVKENKKQIIALTFLSSFLSIFVVIFAYASKLLLDSINTDKFVTFVIVLSILIVLEVILKLTLNISYQHIAIKLENKIKKETLFKYLNNSYFTIDNKNTMDWLTRVNNDSKVIASGVIAYLPNFISLVVRIIFSFIVLLFIDYRFALILLVIGILGFIISKFIRKKNKALHKEGQRQETRSMEFYKNTISHLFLIKLFNISDKIDYQCIEVQKDYIKAKNAINDFSTYINTAFTFIMRLSYIGAIIYASILLSNSSSVLTYGSLLAMIQLISQIEIPFTSLSGLLPRYYQTLGSIERIQEYIVEDNQIYPSINEFNNPIKINNLSFNYSNNEPLFSNLSFDISPNDFILIKGHSGSGKTTLLKVIMGMYPSNNGSVTYLNKPISEYQSLFSYVPQGNYLINASVKDNLTLFSSNQVDEKEIIKVLEVVELKEKIYSLKDNINTLLGDDGYGLSIGEGQRLSIARSLLSSRPILVLDEITSSLDSNTSKNILNNLKGLNKTIIMVSHKDEADSLATKTITL